MALLVHTLSRPWIKSLVKVLLSVSGAGFSVKFRLIPFQDECEVNIFHDEWYNFMLVRWTPASLQIILEVNDATRVSLSTTTPVPPNVWNLITITQDGGLMSVYVNTTKQDVTGTNSRLMLDHLETITVWVGKSHWNDFNGCLDEFRICNTSLTQQHVDELFQNSEPSGLSSNLITHWNWNTLVTPKSHQLATMVDELYSALNKDYSSYAGLMFFPSLAAIPGNAPEATGLPSIPISTTTSSTTATTSTATTTSTTISTTTELISSTESVEFISVASQLTTTIIVVFLSLPLYL
jgi:hypothetical protein